MSNSKKTNYKNSQLSTINRINPAFTLVELIVVIVILAILATIAFLSFSSQSGSARDSSRLADTTSISKWLWVFNATSWTLPMPDGAIIITAWTWYSIFQWTAWKNVLNILKMSEAKDNLDSSYYSYSLDQSKTHYTIWTFLENPPTSFKDIMNPFNLLSSESFNLSYAIDYSKRYFFTKWDWVWILTESWSNWIQPIEQSRTPNSTVNLATDSWNLILNISKTASITWTGNIYWIIQSQISGNFNFNAPSSCPTWFIPVPWNQDFSQPGFCVMKYEAKALNWIVWPVTWTSYHTHDYNTWDVIVSNAQDYPIATITQPQAITACKSLWSWYHLVTENEWMTVARNIEQHWNNWSSWLSWSGFLYSWHNDDSPARALTWSSDDTQWYINTWDASIGSWDGIFTRYNNINIQQSSIWQKRTLILTNWQIIWDFAWNVFELVNKMNTMDWSNFDDAVISSSMCTPTSWYWYSTWETIPAPWYIYASCVFQNNYSYSNIWPKIANLNADNWVGRIYSSVTSNSIFMRWGNWSQWPTAWIYELQANWVATSSNFNWSFRCAK
ncbi:MAG: hypothetical protein ACD_3C00145G0002 [uncultured bacterium (gcode 4)]|uniref:Uncharacterized protein n=1 Tax=uncultured bacterium (gcode 4) TaxID=1234023 RepID=K2F9L0_9BACT|nr:MAG: hypothetical protein ACD_3C00145G0002 [uncultured bacterium (gcode 4)]